MVRTSPGAGLKTVFWGELDGEVTALGESATRKRTATYKNMLTVERRVNLYNLAVCSVGECHSLRLQSLARKKIFDRRDGFRVSPMVDSVVRVA